MAKKVTISEFNEILQKKVIKVQDKLPKAISLCCEQVRSTILDDMARTPRNNSVGYRSGNTIHHPSFPGNAPAPDTGNLRNSIHYTVEVENEQTIGRIGTDVEYGKRLEFGDSKVAPRPWLYPAMNKNNNFIKSKMQEVLND